ncbi:MAG TPA: 4-alpha-glucanotransferase [Candidatus Acidoferrum sp.]|jgi:4-alpha-glucanotransferase
MKLTRSSGILLHPTSLPGRFGIGDLGPECYRFLDFLEAAGQKLWHVLPLGPTGPENSPYQSRSSLAGNPLLISPAKLVEEGYLHRRDVANVPRFPLTRVDFESVRSYKRPIFKQAFAGFSEHAAFRQFENKNAWWLNDYAEFMALSEANLGASWSEFDPQIEAPESEIRFHKFLQFEFFRQWRLVQALCRQKNIQIMGDMPFYVEHDSADVWSAPQLFDLTASGEKKTVGGVPPDYFSADGQLWGNPTYRWSELKRTGYDWWVQRIRAALSLVDVLRLDHFRGFVEYWSVPAGKKTARNGRWKKGPGDDLFQAVRRKLGELPLIAENLGVITPQVEALRHRLGLPGMVVLQFAFGDDGPHRPNNFSRDLVCFTGTHDNNTSKGWWHDLQKAAASVSGSQSRQEIARAKSFLQTDGRDISWRFIQAAMTSVAAISIVPLQDVLALGSEARMNIPGRPKGHWAWRFSEKSITREITERLRELTEVTGRAV